MSADLAAVDQRAIPTGAEEELAGPPHPVLAPVSQQDRISSMDVLRGFSLMGILVMNICAFAYPFQDYTFPLSTIKPVFSGPHWLANTTMWFLRWMLAEGKMRALFSMLFGAGVVLLTSRADARGAGAKVADIYTRRNMWLVIFGMIHGYLIWYGDILFFYGITALLFLYPFRVVKAKKLLWIGGIILFLNSMIVGAGQFANAKQMKKKADAAYVLRAQHKPLTEKQQDDIKSYEKMMDHWRLSPQKIREDIAANQKGYWAAQGHVAGEVIQGHMKGSYFGFGDWLGMMLLGMGLFKSGYLTAKKSYTFYVWCAVIGLGLAWGLTFLGAWKSWKGGFDFFQTGLWMQLPYDVTRVAGAIGNSAALLIIVKAGVLKWITRPIAAVGQMALSNYLLTSLSMKFLFVWGPLHWYGYMEYYKLYIVVACMWAVNLIWSPIWLRYFRFGPMEWVWRSLTYWKRQPMLIRSKTVAPPSPEPVVTAA